MAVKECYLKQGSRRGPVRRTGGGHSYHETWIVRTDSALDDGRVVENAPGLPGGGQGYPEDASAVVTERDPRQTEVETVWEVFIVYTHTRRGPRKKPTTPEELRAWLPVRHWSTIAYRVFCVEDATGTKFLNSAGDPYDPPPPMFRLNRVLTILQSVPGHDERIAKQYLNSTNTDAITIDLQTYPQFSARFNRWDAQLQYLGEGFPYFDTQIEIEFMADGELWFPWEEPDRGARHKVSGKNGLFLPKDDDGVTYQGMVLLDGGGWPLHKDDPFAPEIVYNEFDLFGPEKKLPFTTLGIPFLNETPVGPANPEDWPPPGGNPPIPKPGPGFKGF